MMDRLVQIAGPEGAVTISGTVPNKLVTVQSPGLRPTNPWHIKFDDIRFLDKTRRFLKDYGVELVLVGDPYEGGTLDETPHEDYEPD
jgi:hypothetical protein